MNNSLRIQLFLCLMILFFYSISVCAQTCKPASIPATTNFYDNGDGTTTDLKTGLMWKKCPEGLMGSACETGTVVKLTWQQALQRAQTINSNGGFAGYTDWRLPNIKELKSIVEEQCYDPSANLETFPVTPSFCFWSSTHDSTDGALVVDFKGGDGGGMAWKASLFYVRLVRGGE